MRHLTTAIATLSLLMIAAPALSEAHRGHQRALDSSHQYGRAEREQRHIERGHNKQHDKHHDRQQEKRQRKQERKQERREERQHRREVRQAYKAGYNKGYNKGHRAVHRPVYRRSYHGHRPHHRPSHYGYGYRWRHLPRNFVSISIGAAGFYYSDGIFYRPASSGYVVAQAPKGAIVHSLPASALTVAVGGHNYYVAYDTYYLWDQRHRGYRVVPRPGVI
ncbi:DUF6515 family protein [Microbulbifer sp. SSSA002]|uniref:DUF6515 family protein n=1 Tax=Microbulbifer sp. SSSA002 TaxID=3243376 RepID=UPI0040396DB9